MFYITISNGLLKDGHRKRMGESVWEFMWLLDKVTKIDESAGGWVLGGKPIKLRDIAKDLEVHDTTVSRSLRKLRDEGYIDLLHTPYGVVIKVWKAKKIFGGKSGTGERKNPPMSSTFAERFGEPAKPNIRQDRDNTLSL